jgi:hypothetical protein
LIVKGGVDSSRSPADRVAHAGIVALDLPALVGLTAPDGLISYRELVEAGCTRSQLRNLLRTGQLRRLTRGVYAIRPHEDPQLRVRAVLRVLPPHVAVSHATAADLYGVRLAGTGAPLEFTVCPHADVSPRPGLLVRRGRLGPDDLLHLTGIPVTAPGRTVVDLGRTRPLIDGVVAADALLHAGVCSLEAAGPALAAATGLRGVRRARQALSLADAGAESPMETRIRLVLVLAGLSPPTAQYVVRDPAGYFIARVDLAYPAARLVIEYDGRDSHLEPAAFLRERRRQNALVQLGWTVLRYTAPDVYACPARIVAEVRAALLRAAA